MVCEHITLLFLLTLSIDTYNFTYVSLHRMSPCVSCATYYFVVLMVVWLQLLDLSAISTDLHFRCVRTGRTGTHMCVTNERHESVERVEEKEEI